MSSRTEGSTGPWPRGFTDKLPLMVSLPLQMPTSGSPMQAFLCSEQLPIPSPLEPSACLHVKARVSDPNPGSYSSMCSHTGAQGCSLRLSYSYIWLPRSESHLS